MVPAKMLSNYTGAGISVYQVHFCHAFRTLQSSFILATLFGNFFDKMIKTFSKHGTSSNYVPVCYDRVHGIHLTDLLLSKSKQKHYLNANIFSLTENEIKLFQFQVALMWTCISQLLALPKIMQLRIW